MLEILLHTNTMVCLLLQAIVSGLNRELPGGGGGDGGEGCCAQFRLLKRHSLHSGNNSLQSLHVKLI